MKQLIEKLAICIVCLAWLCSCGQAGPTWQEQYDLGIRYLSEGNYGEAIIAFTAAIEIDSMQAPAYVGRGNAYLLSGNTEESLSAAQVDFEVSIELDETLTDAYIGLAEVYIHYGDYDKALEILLQGFEKNPDDGIKDKIHELLSETDYFIGEESATIDYSNYLTDDMIKKEEFTLGGIPFCKLSIEDAVDYLPPDEREIGIETNSNSDDGGYKQYAAWKSYTSSEPISPISDSYGFKTFTTAPISVRQKSDESTLFLISYQSVHDLHGEHQIIEDIESEARGIATGDSLDVVLQKMGVSAEGSTIIASEILQFGKYSVSSFNFDTGIFKIETIDENNPPLQINFLYNSNKMQIHSDFDLNGKMTGLSVRAAKD